MARVGVHRRRFEVALVHVLKSCVHVAKMTPRMKNSREKYGCKIKLKAAEYWKLLSKAEVRKRSL